MFACLMALFGMPWAAAADLQGSVVETHYLWVANDPEGTVSKLDTRTGREVARYASVTHAVVVDHVGRPFAAWSPSAQLHRPSRLAVDAHGDVWVANGAPGTQPTVTKILNDEGDCADRNGNLTIDTSHDVDGDGRISIGNPAEFFGEGDECIAMTVAVGAQGAPGDYQARALAIDVGVPVAGPPNPGHVWVGMFTEQAFYQLDGTDGSLMQRVPPTGTFAAALGLTVRPFAAAIDSQGRLWSIGGCCGSQSLIRIDTGSNPAPFQRVAVASPGGAYGLTVDRADRVWLGSAVGPFAYRHDPTSGQWATVTIPNSAGWITRGVGIDVRGNIWAAMHGGANSRLARIDANTGTAAGLYDVGGNIAVGVGVDFDGDVWAVNQATSNVSRLHIDPASGEPAPHVTTGNLVDTFPTGPNPYTLGDLIGLGLRVVTRAHASAHLMQIQQVVAGVGGRVERQAVQLRMRDAGQNLVSFGRIRAWDATGANPVMIVDFGTDVANGAVGAHLLVVSSAFADAYGTGDFVMANPIPPSYLAAGRLTYEDKFGTVYWSLSWGGAAYTGPNAGTLLNDHDGNFGPHFGSRLPTSTTAALAFTGPANAMSMDNLSDYSITAGPGTFTTNGGVPRPLPSEVIFGDGFES
jgi:streptogramin lyase